MWKCITRPKYGTNGASNEPEKINRITETITTTITRRQTPSKTPETPQE